MAGPLKRAACRIIGLVWKRKEAKSDFLMAGWVMWTH